MSQKLKEANFAKITAQAKADEAMSDSNVAKVSVPYLFMTINRKQLRYQTCRVHRVYNVTILLL